MNSCLRMLPPLALAVAAVSAHATPRAESALNEKPRFLGEIASRSTDGVTDDLLTAGLGLAGIESPTAPEVSAPPTAAELRRLA